MVTECDETALATFTKNCQEQGVDERFSCSASVETILSSAFQAHANTKNVLSENATKLEEGVNIKSLCEGGAQEQKWRGVARLRSRGD